MMADPKFKPGHSVRSPAGLRGTVTAAATWDVDTGEFVYPVDWDDNTSSTQSESFFALHDSEWRP